MKVYSASIVQQEITPNVFPRTSGHNRHASTPEGDVAGEVVFLEGMAVDLSEGEPTAVYDLEGMRWEDLSSNTSATLAECEAWAKTSIDRTIASAETLPDGPQKDFTVGLVRPNFKVSESNGTLVLENAYFRYEIGLRDSTADLDPAAYYTYDRLSAYHKAMALKQMPPFPQLEVLAAIEERGALPETVAMRITTGGGTMEMTAKFAYTSLSPEEEARLRALVDK